MKAEILKSVDSALAETKTELTATAKEIEKQRKRLDIEGGFRKFLFWATPILLFAQCVLTAILLIR